MSHIDSAFALASRSTPVRDELVDSLDDIFPELKSAQGIPVIKHSKRGQSETRRLRLDTDVSTLEVFRTSTGYLNRKMSTRTYGLSTLEAVGPATSVPGGLPAMPGRTLVFVFRSRNLYVTVNTRDVCAALVALFRPAGGGPSTHASLPSGPCSHMSGDDMDDSGRKRYASSSSASPGSSLWGGRSQGRRLSENAASARAQDRSVVRNSFLISDSGGGMVKGADDGSGAGGGSNYGAGRGRQGRRAQYRGVLKRSASYSAGPDVSSTSSSDDEDVVSSVSSVERRQLQRRQHHLRQRFPDPPSSDSRPVSGRSTGWSPTTSVRSSESPDAIMRSRMVGFGSADLGMDDKPKRVGKTSSFKNPWARFTEGDKKGTPASTTSSSTSLSRLKNPGLAVEGKALAADAGRGDHRGGIVGVVGGEGDEADLPVSRATSIGTGTPSVSMYGRESASPLAVRFEDRLNPDSLRRPVSAPAGVGGPEGKRSPALLRQDDSLTSAYKAKLRTVTASPSGRHQASGGNSGRNRNGDEVPRHTDGESIFAFSRRAVDNSPPPTARRPARPPPKEHREEAAGSSERKIPPLHRPHADGHQQQQQAFLAKLRGRNSDSTADNSTSRKIFPDISYDSSVSPLPHGHGTDNGARTTFMVPAGPHEPQESHEPQDTKGAKGATQSPARDNYTKSSSSNSPNGDPHKGNDRSATPVSTSTTAARLVDFLSAREGRDDDSSVVSDTRDEPQQGTPDTRGGRASSSDGSPGSSSGGRPPELDEDNEALMDMVGDGQVDTPHPVRPGGRNSHHSDAFKASFPLQPKVAPVIAAAAKGAVEAVAAVLVPTKGEADLANDAHAPVLREKSNVEDLAVSAADDDGSETTKNGVGIACGEISEEAAGRDKSDDVTRAGSFETPTLEAVVGKLTIETAPSLEYVAPSEAGTTVTHSDSVPFPSTPGQSTVLDSRVSRDSRGSYGSRGRGGTECTSPDSPPGGAVGEVRTSIMHPPVARQIPLLTGLQFYGAAAAAAAPKRPTGPSGFEELWAVLEPAWGMNSSFGTSMTPKVMLLGEIYERMRTFQAAVASVCVQACGAVLEEVCGRCGRAWAVLASASVQSIAAFPALHKIEKGIRQLIAIVDRYAASAVVRRFTLPLIGAPTAWEELLASGEGGDLLDPCVQIEKAVALLPDEKKDGGKSSSSSKSGGRADVGRARNGNILGGADRLGLIAGVGNKGGGRRSSGAGELRLPPCPSYWAKGQFDRLTPQGLPDVLTLLHEPARFAELAQLVTRASDDGPTAGECSFAWDCVRQVEGPSLGRELRRALSATLVEAGQLLPLPRVPPAPPAYVARESLTEQIEATILHPFLPLGIAGIEGASGSGKTVLAAAVVRDATVRCRFGDRVFWLHAGKGAHARVVSLLQALADTVYAWLTDGEVGWNRRNGGGDGDDGGGGGEAGTVSDPNLREPVRFRDQDQAANYVADLCRGPLLAGLRCLVVVDDVHEREVVDALWKSGCQLLVTSPVKGLLQAVGAEATTSRPFGGEIARQVATGTTGEHLCEKAKQLVENCCGCPLALAMLGAIAQSVLSAGSDTREWKPRRRTAPRRIPSGDGRGGGGGQGTQGGAGGARTGLNGGKWSIGSTFSSFAAPMGAWVEQVVVGTTSNPVSKQPRDAVTATASAAADSPLAEEGWQVASPVEPCKAHGDGSYSAAGAGVAAGPGDDMSSEAKAWASVAKRVDRAIDALQQNKALRDVLVATGPTEELHVRELIAVLTQIALQEADRILGGTGWAVECYLSFALLPEGMPLPPPALEELWRPEDGGSAVRTTIRGPANARKAAFEQGQRAPGPVEVLEALRMVGRAGGGEGAVGLIPHGIQRQVMLCIAQGYRDTMSKMLQRRLGVLSRISSLVGTFDDDCWALGGGGGEGKIKLALNRGTGTDTGDGGDSASNGHVAHPGAGENNKKTNDEKRKKEVTETRDQCKTADSVIPAGLLGSGRPGPPSHGYGGFSRYDYLVASWGALPAAHTLTAAASAYLACTREVCVAAAANGKGGDGGGAAGWARARALASVADVMALAGRGAEAIPAYGEACKLLVAEAAASAEADGIPQWQRSAKSSIHKLASMVEELAILAAQLGKEATAIRLLQRAVEMHLNVLEATGSLVPEVDGNRRNSTGGVSDDGSAKPTNAKMADEHEARGRGGSLTCRAVAEDTRPLSSRLRFHPSVGAGMQSPSGRGSIWGGSGSGGGSSTLPMFGRLDMVGTCVGDLGLVVSCTRQLRQEKKIDESVQLAEKAYPVLKDILGADHAFTKAALAAFVGQGIVDECWSQSDAGNGALGHPSLPSPTSRRRLARSYEARAPSAGGGRNGSGVSGSGGIIGAVGGSSARSASSAAALTPSELSSPPSPLPEEFYTRYSSSLNGTQTSTRSTSSARQSGSRADSAGLGSLPLRSRGGGRGQKAHPGSAFSNTGSASSGTDGDEAEDSDGGGRRRAGRVGRGSGDSILPWTRRGSDRASKGYRLEGQGWQREFGSMATSERGSLELASTRMQQELYFRHRTRRARAHAFLITAATRARLKTADRAEAGLFLIDLARQVGASYDDEGAGSVGDGGTLSPDGATQMARLTAPTGRR